MKTRLQRLLARALPPAAVLVIVVLGLEAYLRVEKVHSYMMPLPSAIGRAFIAHAGELASALGWTALSAVGAFVASSAAGVMLAAALSSSRLLRRAFYPYTVFFQTVPIVAIAPMLLFWIGSGPLPVAVCAFIVSIFPVIANTLTGILSTDPALVDLFKLHGAGPMSLMWKLRLPGALPSIFTGMRIAAGLSVIGAVVAEFLVGQSMGNAGLGILIVDGIHQARLDIAFAAVLLASMLGLTLFAVVNLASWLALRHWHASAS